MTTLRRAWDENADDWIRWARSPGHDVFFWELGLPALLDMLPEPGRLTVEVGCGEGRVLRVLRDRGHTIVGLDGSGALARAAATHPDATAVAVADAAALPVRSHAADLVVAYMTLQDIDDLDAAVAEAARVLEPGGRFCSAFVHPVDSAGDLGDPVIDGVRYPDGSDRALTIHDYFTPRRLLDVIERDGLRMAFHSEHRPLERYARAFEMAGFLIESIREPVPGEAMIAEKPMRVRWTRIPWGLFLRAVRSDP